MRISRYLLLISGLFLLLAGLSGCTAIRGGIAALRSTSDFVALDSDNRVLYEPGTEEFAKEIAGYLPDAIATVEKEQYRPFAKPIIIYICATKESFAAHTGFWEKTRGAVTTKLFLSPEMIKRIQDGSSAKMILTHEISHLHLYQRLGLFRDAKIPAWFKEGLAVMVSGGAPAVDVSESDAAKAIQSGECIKPDVSGSLLFPKFWHSYNLEPHMFYRQSGMFVAYMKRQDEAKFKMFMLSIENGRNFGKSFSAAYGISIEKSW